MQTFAVVLAVLGTIAVRCAVLEAFHLPPRIVTHRPQCWEYVCLKTRRDWRSAPRKERLDDAFRKRVVTWMGGDEDENGNEKGGDEEEGESNPYQDENYPDLEFVDYSDPEYSADRGSDDYIGEAAAAAASAFGVSKDDTEEVVEEMREERRRKNDEFQFETYFRDMLKDGESFFGEWTVYRTSTFIPGMEDDTDQSTGIPRLVKGRDVMHVVSSGAKVAVQSSSPRAVDGFRIVHAERLASPQEKPEASAALEQDPVASSSTKQAVENEIIAKTYSPEQMSAYDFRGPQGIMCVGNAYTTASSVSLNGQVDEEFPHDGPFSELRTEIGIQYKRMRFRVKLDYRTPPRSSQDEETDLEEGPTLGAADGVAAKFGLFGTSASSSSSYQPPPGTYPPPLLLFSLTVCREAWERWPRYDGQNTDDDATTALFGTTGADGGLYDPPPVGGDAQAERYMMIDLEGQASVLLPFKMDQDPAAFNGNGWVTSLDWTPGRMRYQVDRKVLGGNKIKGLRTLELSEVQSAEADKWRPRDGGADMRQ